MVFVSILLKNAHIQANRIKENRNEYVYCKKNQPKFFGFENSKEKIFFDDIYKGELFSALYLALAATKIEISKWIKENTSLKYIKYEPEARAVVVENNTSIFLCFRGTQMDDKVDIATDFNIISEKQFGGKIHQGFYYRAKSVDILSIYLLAKSKGKRLIFCGHSLGGAVATISTLIVLFSEYFNEKDVDIYCITFGSPICLSREVVDNCRKSGFQKHFINFVNEGDVIPSSSNRNKACINILLIYYYK